MERRLADMQLEVFDQIRQAAACEVARHLGGCPDDPKARGWYAERVVARRLSAGLWGDLEKALQRVIHNDASLKDQGVDLVTIRGNELELVQVKWYGQTQTIGVDVVAKLVNIAVACQERLGLAARPRMRCVYRDGCRLARNAVNFDLVEWDPWPPEIVEGARPCPPSPPRTGKDGEVYGPELAARLEGLQQRAFEAILGAKAGARHLRVQMPVGAGKSHVAFALARHVLAESAHPAFIVAPRGEIVNQLAALGSRQENRAIRVLRAGRPGEEWPQAGRNALVVATSQMMTARLKKAGRPFKVSLLVVDEAHNATGQDAIASGAVEWDLRVDLSACPPADGVPPVHTVSWADAVQEKAVCDVLFHFVHFAPTPRPLLDGRPRPWYGEMAEHLDAHPDRYRSILACFQTVQDARGFVDHYRARCGEAVAGCFVEDDRRDSLDAFRAGRLRVLCVVGRVEMGVNIHRCDTVLFMDPWNSLDRTLQLMGRGCRLHPEKAGFFRVVVGFSAEDPCSVTQDRLGRFLTALGGVYPDLAGDPQEFLGRVRHLAGGRDGEVPAALEHHVADVREAHARQIAENIYGRSGLVDRAAYEATRDVVRPLRLLSPEAYWAFLLQGSTAEPDRSPYLPDDPAAWFGHLFEGGGAEFPWSEFLGTDGEEAAGVGEKLRAAYVEALSKGDLDTSSLGAWAGDLVYLILRQTSAGASLPECPPLEEKGWPSFYHRHLELAPSLSV